MAQSNRKQYGEARNVALTSQVDGVCPRCDKPLFYKKSGKSFKAYEIAHIYPLNPSPEEIAAHYETPTLLTGAGAGS